MTSEIIEHYFASRDEASVAAGVARVKHEAGRIDAVRPVAEIIESTAREFSETLERMSKAYG